MSLGVVMTKDCHDDAHGIVLMPEELVVTSVVTGPLPWP
jgi:hypothetical protein